MPYTGIKIVSIYDPLTGTVVQLNDVTSDGSYKVNNFQVEVSNGSLLDAGAEQSFEFGCFDYSVLPQLESWMYDEVKVNFVTYGLDTHIIWYASSYITVTKSYGFKTGERNNYKIQISTKGQNLPIYIGSNLLYMAKGWSGTTGAGNVATNYISCFTTNDLAIDAETGFLVQTLAEQTNTTHPNGDPERNNTTHPNDYYAKFTYPIANITLYFNRDSRTGKVEKPLAYDLEYYPAQLEVMSFTNVVSELDAHISGNGPDWGTGTFTLPSGVYHLRLFLAISTIPASTDNEGVEICNPYLGTDIQFNGQNKNF